MNDKLSRLIEEAKASVAAMTPAERAAMWAEQRRSFVRAEAGFGSDRDEAAYRDAVGRCDKAEIARLDREADERVAAALGWVA